MNDFLAQIMLARNGEDIGWMQLLVVVVLAVFYVLGTILKAKSNKAEQKDEEQPEGTGASRAFQKTAYRQVQRPGSRPPHRRQPQQPRRKVMRPQPVGWKFAAEEQEAVRLKTPQPPRVLKLPVPTPQVQIQPELEEVQEFIGEPLKPLGDEQLALSAETEASMASIQPLLDYADTEGLKRAILHYEILGKPLSLRGPSEHIIGL